MARHMKIALFAIPLVFLVGCDRAKPARDNKTVLADLPRVPEVKDIVPSTSSDSAKSRLLAAAEPFEGLTEAAFDPDRAKVDVAIAKARSEAHAVRALLPAEGQAILDKHLAEIQSAQAAKKPADLALASVEIYRLLVTQGSGASPVPKEVSLLDYAGFRFTAELKAKPSRWSEMASTVEFARQNWAVVKPQVKDAATAKKFEAALENMAASAAIKNADLAQASATAELDLVDVLEQSFNGH